MKFEAFENVFRDVTSTFNKVKKEDYQETGLYPIIDQGQEFIGGYTDYEKLISKENFPAIIFGDHTKIFKYVDFPFTIGADGVKVLALADRKSNAQFYYYFLKSLKIVDKGYSRHFKYLKEKKLPVTEYENQLHIANLLSKAEKLIAQRKESICLLDEFLKSTFLEMFGGVEGEKVSLNSACIFNPKKSEISSLDKETEVSFIPMALVSETGEVELSQTRKLDSVWNGYTYFREGDVVFAKITPCMENGKGALMKNLTNGIGFGTTEFHVLRPINGISTSAWIYHLTMQDSFRKKAEQNMTGSAGQKRVPSDFFERYKLVIPPIDLQTQFAQIVEKTEALKSQYQQSLQELEQLYGSLSQRAFRGELVKN